MGRRLKNKAIRLKSAIILNLLAESGVTIKELSIRTGEMGMGDPISYKYLSELLSDDPRSIPSLVVIGKIAKALGIEPWQIADGLEPPQTFEVREDQAPYLDQSSRLVHILRAKVDKASLTSSEKENLRQILKKAVDIMTIENAEKRKCFSTTLAGAVEGLHSAVFPEGEREEGSSILKKEGG